MHSKFAFALFSESKNISQIQNPNIKIAQITIIIQVLLSFSLFKTKVDITEKMPLKIHKRLKVNINKQKLQSA
ncbi:hypothetical protein VO56_00390 [Mycoplasmopsis gallinacea]|uniref:Uncharacterized protein n=1 Tax=Mycoplasmopsis gallinacea TaxID=29556 RepID=A0A0D5ZII0_9BACT|nr:hypothetical protein VO56_00390 [Mycoplasmopsis gallinacea]